ncbi:MAG: GNAT family N-acetyltransferase [Candidatus Latescibacteria bacterium]|jgi:tagatose 1,6-diphosphate aldolase|nr:GNAT family N-acetyltransferase [Candidatus Latescibacterota bacterium]
MSDTFQFLDPGTLIDRDLQLVLVDQGYKDPEGDRVPFYLFGMKRVPDGANMGGIMLRIGDAATVLRYACHLGFDVRPEHRGRRYAARSVGLLLPFARRQGLDKVWIGCDPDNAASRRTCELAGGAYQETIPVPPDIDLYEQGMRLLRRHCIDVKE